MKKIILNTCLVFLFFIIQCSLFHIFSANGVYPNVLIILVATCGFMQGEKSGILVGFFCGLLMDIFFFEIVGFYALLYMYIGYANGLFRNVFYPDDIKLPLIMIFRRFNRNPIIKIMILHDLEHVQDKCLKLNIKLNIKLIKD